MRHENNPNYDAFETLRDSKNQKSMEELDGAPCSYVAGALHDYNRALEFNAKHNTIPSTPPKLQKMRVMSWAFKIINT